MTTPDSTNIVYGTGGFVTVNSTDLGHYLGEIAAELATSEYYPDLSRAMGPVAGTGKVTGKNRVEIPCSACGGEGVGLCSTCKGEGCARR